MSRLLVPFEVLHHRVLAANSRRPVLHEKVSFDTFKKLSKAGEIPVGAKWVASLGIIYGPEAKT